jgi:hypothetical protein
MALGEPGLSSDQNGSSPAAGRRSRRFARPLPASVTWSAVGTAASKQMRSPRATSTKRLPRTICEPAVRARADDRNYRRKRAQAGARVGRLSVVHSESRQEGGADARHPVLKRELWASRFYAPWPGLQRACLMAQCEDEREMRDKRRQRQAAHRVRPALGWDDTGGRVGRAAALNRARRRLDCSGGRAILPA